MQAAVQVRVDHQPAAHKGVHKQVQEVLQVAPAPCSSSATQAAEVSLANSRAARSWSELARRRSIWFQASTVPRTGPACGASRPAETALPHPRRPVASRSGPSARRASVHVVLNGGQQVSMHPGRRNPCTDALANLAGKVHQQPVGAAPANLDADGKGTVRVEASGTEGWPIRPRTGVAMINWSSSSRVVIRPMVWAVRPVRRANLGLGQAAVEAYGLQHHPLVELAHAHVVGAARTQQQLRVVRPGGLLGGEVSWTQSFADDALAQHKVAKGLHFAGQHDGIGALRVRKTQSARRPRYCSLATQFGRKHVQVSRCKAERYASCRPPA
jgi:hypothetical protein